MPKKLPQNLFELVQAELAPRPQGASIEELSTRLVANVSRRSLQRKLAEYLVAGHVRAEGVQRGRRYFLPVAPAGRFIIAAPQVPPDQNGSFVTRSARDDYPALSTAGREVLALIRRSLFDRPVIGYSPNIVAVCDHRVDQEVVQPHGDGQWRLTSNRFGALGIIAPQWQS